MEPKSAENYRAIKRKILTNVAALSLLFAMASTQGSPMGRGDGDYHGDGYGYPTYGYAPSTVGPAYVDSPWGYGFDTYGFDGEADYELPPPAPNPVGPPKTIEIPPGHGQ
jgi:hypothetical protein